ncbi:permease [Methermicoccus shengliensis]|uniref:permease n=1 Tax=Methermicoccus shengliensis TaxID=660064 RepID=UPI000694366A|nr:permease [Methermicoccus shengliensis]KUK04324.1 MAG: DUF318-domain predicted permease [Euryarchaeota archaeon 55_53]KUK30667.1 MAG: DUF318-domain predicted permease [Methanosarcinales archeaon 56_1174]MDN5295491.1 uncharacterized protein [Methanosarcinales archaeon]
MDITVLINGAIAFVAEYLSAHVLTCLVPAFFLAGAIAALFSKEVVLTYLGADAKKSIAYPVAALSGSLLAVCSCTVLPLFAGVYRRGAGLGPATTFLFSAPAINVLAVVYTAKALGLELGAVRAVGAIGCSVVIGVLMAALFERHKEEQQCTYTVHGSSWREHRKSIGIFVLLLSILVLGGAITDWVLKASALIPLTVLTGYAARSWYTSEELSEWMRETWFLVKMIVPLLLGGVFLMGIVVQLLPAELIARYLGGNTLMANTIASLSGALMYFATLTEVPIVGGLMQLGMGKGPALAMLLAGPALSLPNMIVISRVMGTRRAAAYISMVVVFSIVLGLSYGYIACRMLTQL